MKKKRTCDTCGGVATLERPWIGCEHGGQDGVAYACADHAERKNEMGAFVGDLWSPVWSAVRERAMR